MRKLIHNIEIGCFIVGVISLLISCAGQKKIKHLNSTKLKASVGLVYDNEKKGINKRGNLHPDSLLTTAQSVTVKDLSGNRIIMNAIKDEESGEMVATDILNEIVVEAKFRNIAEKNGEVDIAFEIRVPKEMQDPNWQVRFKPCFYILKDTLYSEEVHITGAKYRDEQLKGYALYKNFLNSIIPDSSDYLGSFCYQRLMDIFIARKFDGRDNWSNDTVVRQEVIDYYTKHWLVYSNNKKKLMKDEMYNKYVKQPIITDGVRLDSVITELDGTLKYNYVQTIRSVKGLKRADMVLSGGIFAKSKRLYEMPNTEPLAFYISSLSTFADTSTRYEKTVIARDLNINTAAYIDFLSGDNVIIDTLHNNTYEINRIKQNIRDILSQDNYIADSLVITASCSPEGKLSANYTLSQKRANSINQYFTEFIKFYRDSIKSNLWDINLDGSDKNYDVINSSLVIKSNWIAEEWNRLESMIKVDTLIRNLPEILKCFEITDLDKRELAMQICTDYKYIRKELYPWLRTVKFNFYLHRKGMVKDTIHTTQIDTAYMAGIKALVDREYGVAIEKLRPYNDFNTAVAYTSLDYNESAKSILELLPRGAKRDYMLAIVYARIGEEERAVGYFINSCEQDSSMRFRGNLDPEISYLIKKYNINN